MDHWREGAVQRLTDPKKKKVLESKEQTKLLVKDVTTWGARNVSRYLALACQKKFKKKKNLRKGLTLIL